MGLRHGVPSYLGRVGLKPALCHCGKRMVWRLNASRGGRAYHDRYCTACGCGYDSQMGWTRTHVGDRCPDSPRSPAPKAEP